MPQQFDTTRVTVVKVQGSPDLRFAFAYPEDKDWADRARNHPSFSAVKGDEIQTVSTDTSAFDKTLLLKLLGEKPPRLPDGQCEVPAESINHPGVFIHMNGSYAREWNAWPELDGEFAKRILARMDTTNILDEECSADSARITVVMRVGVGNAPDGSPGNYLTKHIFRIPSARDIDKFFASSRQAATRIKKREIRQTTLLEPGGELYDRCIADAEGYASRVPLNHKAAAASKLAELADMALEPEFDEDPKG